MTDISHLKNVPTSFNQQPIFDAFQKPGFREAKHNPFKVAWWALNLLSGRFKQGKQELEAEDGTMCCLGVGARVCGIPRQIDEITGAVTYDGHSSIIDPNEFLGGTQNWSEEYYPDFWKANDKRDATFREIGWWLLSTLLPARKSDAENFGSSRISGL